MHNIMVAGIGTEVGKSVVSAILASLFQADYWKPIQCGNDPQCDTEMMKQWLDPTKHKIHPPAYNLKAPLSPHHAARLENQTISLSSITLPLINRPLIIEGVGGVLVPLTKTTTTIDLFKSWPCQWVVVSKHYLGSINHTLLTLKTLNQYGIPLLGIIFNGLPNPDTEEAILEISGLPCLGRLLPEPALTPLTFKTYAKQWHQQFLPYLI